MCERMGRLRSVRVCVSTRERNIETWRQQDFESVCKYVCACVCVGEGVFGYKI